MGEIDDPHDPVDQAQAPRDQEEHGGVQEGIEEMDQEDVHEPRIRCLNSRRGINPKLGRRHLGIDLVVPEDERDERGVGAGLQLALEVDEHLAALHLVGGARRGDGPVGADHHVAADRDLRTVAPGRAARQRLANEAVLAEELLDPLDLGRYLEAVAARHDARDVGAARDGEAIEAADTHRIGEVAEHLEHHRAVRPLGELIRPIGHEEVAAAPGVLLEGVPSVLGLVGRDEALEALGDIRLPGEAVDEPGERLLRLRVPGQVEPADAAPPRLLRRERAHPALDGLFHQHEHVPRHGAPRRRLHRHLLGVPGERAHVDVDHGHDVREGDVAVLLHLRVDAAAP